MGNQNSNPVAEPMVDNSEINPTSADSDQPENCNSTTSTIQPSNDTVEFITFLQSLPEDGELNKILEISKRLMGQKPDLVQKIRDAEKSLKLHHRNVAISKITGSSVGIASGISFIAGIFLVPATAGLSLGIAVGGGLAGGATFVGADLAGNRLIKKELTKIQKELNDFHKELKVIAEFDHQGLLAHQVKRFGKTLVELESFSETEFVDFLKKIYEAVTLKITDDLGALGTDINQLIQQVIDMVTDDKKMWDLIKTFLMPFLDKKTKADLERLRTILKFLMDSARQIYCYIKKIVHFIIPLNREELPAEAIARVVAGVAITGFKVASESGQIVTKIAPQILRGLGYAAGGIAIVVDLGFLIHTCVTMDNVPHVEALRSLADQMDRMDILEPLSHPQDVGLYVETMGSLADSTDGIDLESVPYIYKMNFE